mmetsp:Transcript_35207/g.49027  ORF Transcript_35207/g.49027 Transcript_35207/m.49027 type:complete len:89 (-) Transcript_35207:142-408(-)
MRRRRRRFWKKGLGRKRRWNQAKPRLKKSHNRQVEGEEGEWQSKNKPHNSFHPKWCCCATPRLLLTDKLSLSLGFMKHIRIQMITIFS